MSLSSTSEFIKLDGSILSAECENLAGDSVSSAIDLNTIMGVEDGEFVWGRAGFATIVANIALHRDSEGVLFLMAKFNDPEQCWQPTGIVLDDRIANLEGVFSFK